MHKMRSIVLITFLIEFFNGMVLFGETSPSVEPWDTLVMVIMRSAVGSGAGNGFVIGNGSLVVTAHHLVFGQSKKGRHQEPGRISVVSPYLGDGCEARILASDEELDLAVLKIPWVGHPTLKLTDAPALLSAERLIVMGIPDIIQKIGPSTYGPFGEKFDVKSENLAVSYVAIRHHTPLFISLGETGQLEHGWSGSPMLLPDSNIVVGCFTALHITKGERAGAIGPAVTQVRRLLRQRDDEKSLEPASSILPRSEDGIDAFLSFIRAYDHYLKDQYDRASDSIAEFIRLRPESSFAYILSASNADKQKDFDLAEQHYRKAIAPNPEAPGPKLYYAQFLTSRNPDKALEMYKGIWHVNDLKPSIAMLMYNILVERDEFERAHDLVDEALTHNPRNAYLRMALGGCQYKLDKLDEAIENYTKAVELLPERGPFRGRLAHLLEETNKLDEAEKHYRELLKIEPKNPVVYVWLAQFLAKHRPQARDEALKVAQTALELPPKRGLPRQKIEQIIQNLQSQTEPAP